MARERVKLFEAAVTDDDDLSRFTPAAVSGATLEQVRAVSESAGFPSRDAHQSVAKPHRHYYRTGRDTQFNTKVRPDTKAGFETIARQQGVPLGKVLEDALTALQEKIAQQRPSRA